MKVGFVGLGVMGRPMAKNLIKAGYSLTVYDKFASTEEFKDLGVDVGDSCVDIAKNADIVILMLPNSPHVEEAVLGENGIVDGAREGLILVDMSSISPESSKRINDIVIKKGILMLDAPVSGGEPKAVEGTLAIMVGGELSTFETAKPILEVMGSSVTHVGSIGSGNVVKLANQIIVAINIAAVSEAFLFASKSGVKPEVVFDAIRGGLAGSTVMDAKVPMIINRDFNPGFRIELHIKDLNNAVEAAHANSSPIPLTSIVSDMLQVLKGRKLELLDHSAIARYYELVADYEIS